MYGTRLEARATRIEKAARMLHEYVAEHERMRHEEGRSLKTWHAEPDIRRGNASKECLLMQCRILRNELLSLAKMLEERAAD